ncbi:hypothetical protein [Mahella australiensis]|uniref:Uncharacterized protein n=1 Tax=Mahella australiensis (strain DSM 15567 / CIP 107919 / 50-1 BON) TaxID=697281 RepID=F4A0F8_MAHA5|nr:hypothetical protein [Mahella australiensis]AEE98019.1 hypothetical protein Mahau_2897 [Mahella australiensis 50-1 BON]
MASQYLRYVSKINKDLGKQVNKLTVKLVAKDFTGTVRATDVQLQEGKLLTGWAPAASDMLKRRRDSSGNAEPPKHFNALIRGSVIVLVPNRGTVTTGLDWEASIQKNTTGPFMLEIYYRTRAFRYAGALHRGDTVTVDAATHTVKKNGQPADHSEYAGAQMTCPAGDAMYRITMTGRDTARFVFQITEWDVKEGVTW